MATWSPKTSPRTTDAPPPGPPGDPARVAWLQARRAELDAYERRLWRGIWLNIGLAAAVYLALAGLIVAVAVR